MTPAAPIGTEDIGSHIWRMRYRQDGERSVDDSYARVARAIAAPEGNGAIRWEEPFHALMRGGYFLPGGRVLAGAGTGRRVTLFNCFVMGDIEDSIEGIFRALQESAMTMQQGGGIGHDFSTLRPRGMRAKETGTVASGPVSFMHVWDRMCATMLSTGTRSGAMMATLRCDHPDIGDFIEAKREAGTLSYFNLSVLVTEAFVAAVREDREWPLVFPGEAAGQETVERTWSGHDGPVTCTVHRRVRARALWERLMRAAYAGAEPGVLFIDRINRSNNLHYCEQIGATNPCGEVPLPPYGACDLGSINLTAFVKAPFTAVAQIDEAALQHTTRIAVRMLDNVIDVSRFPLPEQQMQAKRSRRIGLGIMGLADALIMLGIRYNSDRARLVAAQVMKMICHEAYRASTALAEEKGAFPSFDGNRYLAAPFVEALPADIRDGIGRHGIRNSHLTAIAPTGTISLLAGHVSSGLEPLLASTVKRKIVQADGSTRSFMLTAHSVQIWQRQEGVGLPPAFVSIQDISPLDQLAMQAALQPYVDNAISKTLTIPADYPFEVFVGLYEQANALGLKGCTVFRPGGARGCIAKPID
jgi:ribonucleoside-diphosphate reductase alpha chain